MMEQNKRHQIEVADILRRYGQNHYFNLCSQQKKAYRAIINCRTDQMGGHISQCNHCGHSKPVYNSCRNRHCPKCQFVKQQQWIAKLKASLPPTSYYHLVFTVPQSLNKLFYINQDICYGFLFKAAYKALHNAAANPAFLGAETGCVAILHTWGQALTYHPHIHMIVPAGGLSHDGVEWIPAGKKFFLPVKALSKMFRGILCRLLKNPIDRNFIKLPDNFFCFNMLQTELYKKNFNVYSKKTFRGAGGVIEYLGRYTHRVAICNDRILSIEDHNIRFRWKDYKSGGINKIINLGAGEFIRRFMQHVLPNGFYKIRYYGLLASVNAKSKRVLIFQLMGAVAGKSIFDGLAAVDVLQTITGINPQLCPICRKGIMKPLSCMLPKATTPL